MQRSAVTVIAPALAALLVSAVGCGGDGDDPARTAPAGARPAAAIRVVETEFKLDPANPRIERAGKITFEVANEGDTVHALEIEAPDREFETDRIEPGQSQTLEAELPPGRYTWYCPVGNHRDLGMAGTVTVGEPPGGSGSDEPQDEGTGGGYGY